jgi:hypothetical protein
MHLRFVAASWMIVFSILASQRTAEASAILFTDRAQFDAALNGNYQLFTDFPITDFSLAGSFIGIGSYGGVRFAGDVFNQIAFGSALSSIGTPYQGPSNGSLSPSLTQPVTAVGFDLLSSIESVYDGGPFPSSSVPTDALFGFGTTNGMFVQTSVAPGSFFGVVLMGDVFSTLFWSTAMAPNCYCGRAITIDNLAVQSVAEPSSAFLLFTGVVALLARCRERRRAGR